MSDGPLAIVPNTVHVVVGNPAALRFPTDDAAHSGHMIEWWQWWVHLQTEDGRRFGAVVVFMNFPVSSALGTAGAGVRRTDFRVTDLSNNTFHYGSKYSAEPLEVVPDGFKLESAGQTAQGGNGRDALHIAVDGYALDLRVAARNAPAPIVNPAGFVRIDPVEVAHVYERWRMTAGGTLRKEGRILNVTGSSWFEHGWGTLPATIQWDCFQLELNDGRDILVVQVRRAGGAPNFLYTGGIRDKRGVTTYLHQGDFDITPTGIWRRDATCTYPSGWRLRIRGEYFTITPDLKNQEVRSVFGHFWDGETTVTGSGRGRGTAEMFNHCYVPQPAEFLH